MKIKINGKEETLDKSKISAAEVLHIANVESPEMVSVQVNGEFVKDKDLGTTYLKDGDEIDFLYMMGGGQ